jgi:hypothetical protein
MRYFLDSYQQYLEQEAKRLEERRASCKHEQSITICICCKKHLEGTADKKILRLIRVRIGKQKKPVV